MRLLLAVSLMIVGLTAVRADDKAIQEEKKKLDGVWKPVSAEMDGKPVPEQLHKIEVKGDKFVGLGPEMTFVLDPTRTPRHIDLISRVGGMDVKAPAIYELTDDELRLCIPLTEKGKPLDLKRPKGFDTKAAPVILIRLKRVK